MAGLTGKNGRESGIWEPYCGPSSLSQRYQSRSTIPFPGSIQDWQLVYLQSTEYLCEDSHNIRAGRMQSIKMDISFPIFFYFYNYITFISYTYIVYYTTTHFYTNLLNHFTYYFYIHIVYYTASHYFTLLILNTRHGNKSIRFTTLTTLHKFSNNTEKKCLYNKYSIKNN